MSVTQTSTTDWNSGGDAGLVAGVRGFSLLEMMAVINLTLLLAVFGLPGFHSASY